jgi:hypothetical protein
MEGRMKNVMPTMWAKEFYIPFVVHIQSGEVQAIIILYTLQNHMEMNYGQAFMGIEAMEVSRVLPTLLLLLLPKPMVLSSTSPNKKNKNSF